MAELEYKIKLNEVRESILLSAILDSYKGYYTYKVYLGGVYFDEKQSDMFIEECENLYISFGGIEENLKRAKEEIDKKSVLAKEEIFKE